MKSLFIIMWNSPSGQQPCYIRWSNNYTKYTLVPIRDTEQTPTAFFTRDAAETTANGADNRASTIFVQEYKRAE